MSTLIQLVFLATFIIIFSYLFLRIMINTKFNKLDVVKELYLVGLVSSVIFIICLGVFALPTVVKYPLELSYIPFKLISHILSSRDISSISFYVLGNILIFIPLGFFAYYCFEKNTRDSMLMCFLITIVIQGINFMQPGNVSHFDNVLLNLIGGFIGIFLSYNFVKKTQLRC